MNETPSDKKEPKFTFEQALKAVQPKIDALLKDALSGFEVGTKDGYKRLYGAFVHAGMETVLQHAKSANAKEVKAYSLARRADKAASILDDKYPAIYAVKPKLEAIDGGLEDDDEVEDEDEGSENDDD